MRHGSAPNLPGAYSAAIDGLAPGPLAGSCGTAKDRMDGHVTGVECEDWFFCTKAISEDEVEAAIRHKSGS